MPIWKRPEAKEDQGERWHIQLGPARAGIPKKKQKLKESQGWT